MNLEEFYEDHMKGALEYFGLSWSEMNLVSVRICDGWFTFQYQALCVSIDMSKPK